VQPYLERLDGCVEALDRMEAEVEGDEAWFVARDELKQLLRGGATDPWLVDEASPAVGLGSVKFADLSMTRTTE
jgi:hypothetical protein